MGAFDSPLARQSLEQVLASVGQIGPLRAAQPLNAAPLPVPIKPPTSFHQFFGNVAGHVGQKLCGSFAWTERTFLSNCSTLFNYRQDYSSFSPNWLPHIRVSLGKYATLPLRI